MRLPSFILNMAVVSAFVWPLTNYHAVLVGWGVVAVGAIILSLEPFTGAVFVIAALIVTVFVISPITGAGATVIATAAAIHGLVVLIRKSRRNTQLTKDFPGDENPYI